MLTGVGLGFALTLVVGALTFVAHRRLPYRRMLVLTGVMLGLVMLSRFIPDWMGLWFAVFPTAETLAAQAVAAALVVGSYYSAREQASSPVAG